jgi:hypothetical protein
MYTAWQIIKLRQQNFVELKRIKINRLTNSQRDSGHFSSVALSIFCMHEQLRLVRCVKLDNSATQCMQAVNQQFQDFITYNACSLQ